MSEINDIMEWQELGSQYQMYVRHHLDHNEKPAIQIIFEDTTHNKTTEMNIPHQQFKAFLKAVNGPYLSKKYEINV